jgi:hypothetical protein
MLPDQFLVWLLRPHVSAPAGHRNHGEVVRNGAGIRVSAADLRCTDAYARSARAISPRVLAYNPPSADHAVGTSTEKIVPSIRPMLS